jgi:hypothetical protein
MKITFDIPVPCAGLVVENKQIVLDDSKSDATDVIIDVIGALKTATYRIDVAMRCDAVLELLRN